MYNIHDLSKAELTVATNVSPATLIPSYDPDTCLLYLSGKVHVLVIHTGLSVDLDLNFDFQGDNSVIVFEYTDGQLYEVSPFSCGSPHQVSKENSPLSLGFPLHVCLV